MTERISVVIIKEKKILLVSTNKSKGYWSPGGRAKSGESHMHTLKRELKEELNVELNSVKLLLKYNKKEPNQKGYYYLVTIKGDPVPSGEINYLDWFNKEDLMNKKIKITQGIKENLLPKLIKNSLI